MWNLSLRSPAPRQPEVLTGTSPSVFISSTLEALPPNLAGKAPLWITASLIASLWKGEKRPRICPWQWTGIPSRRIRFSSEPPPRTYIPESPSVPACIPGSNWMVFSTSLSPRMTGVPFIILAGTVIEETPSLAGFLLALTTASLIRRVVSAGFWACEKKPVTKAAKTVIRL